jgi:hypothetical protein
MQGLSLDAQRLVRMRATQTRPMGRCAGACCERWHTQEREAGAQEPDASARQYVHTKCAEQAGAHLWQLCGVIGGPAPAAPTPEGSDHHVGTLRSSVHIHVVGHQP